MNNRLLTACTLMTITCTAISAQDIGIAPVELGSGPWFFDTAEQHDIRVDIVVRGLNHPFSFALLPDGDALIVERGADLRLVRGATGAAAALAANPVQGTPQRAPFRGAGLHDIALHPRFEDNGLVYFTYNRPGTPDSNADPSQRPPTALTLARARFDGTRLSGGEDLFAGEEIPGGSGSRIAFGPDDTIFLTSGAPFTDDAQRPDNVYGKVLRINADGSIPRDNPFANTRGARGEVYSLGHRDQLGLTVHESGAVLAVEHGPNGGDELNVILPGANYGWPDYSFGRSYEGPRISQLPLGPNTEQPLVLWVPSIAPTGMTFYTAERIPAWTGNLFVGSARRGQIPRTGGLERIVFNEQLEELRRESLLGELHQRIRDVREGPDGLLYVITDEDDGALLRISPATR
jgi:glucose/arabinose dehydrogenase